MGYPVPNTDDIIAVRVQCPVANRAVQLPDFEIPDDMSLVIKAWYLNAGIIQVGRSSSQAQGVETSWPLVANEPVAYRVGNANHIWIAATVAGEWAVVTAEQRLQGGSDGR